VEILAVERPRRVSHLLRLFAPRIFNLKGPE
jgi:hypothetical protein